MTDRDTAAALAKAMPAGIAATCDGDMQLWRDHNIADHQAERLAEAGWVLVRPGDEATVERVARQTFMAGWGESESGWDTLEPYQLDFWRRVARATIAALAAWPGTADTAHTEVEA